MRFGYLRFYDTMIQKAFWLKHYIKRFLNFVNTKPLQIVKSCSMFSTLRVVSYFFFFFFCFVLFIYQFFWCSNHISVKKTVSLSDRWILIFSLIIATTLKSQYSLVQVFRLKKEENMLYFMTKAVAFPRIRNHKFIKPCR